MLLYTKSTSSISELIIKLSQILAGDFHTRAYRVRNETISELIIHLCTNKTYTKTKPTAYRVRNETNSELIIHTSFCEHAPLANPWFLAASASPTRNDTILKVTKP